MQFILNWITCGGWTNWLRAIGGHTRWDQEWRHKREEHQWYGDSGLRVQLGHIPIVIQAFTWNINSMFFIFRNMRFGQNVQQMASHRIKPSPIPNSQHLNQFSKIKPRWGLQRTLSKVQLWRGWKSVFGFRFNNQNLHYLKALDKNCVFSPFHNCVTHKLG